MNFASHQVFCQIISSSARDLIRCSDFLTTVRNYIYSTAFFSCTHHISMKIVYALLFLILTLWANGSTTEDTGVFVPDYNIQISALRTSFHELGRRVRRAVLSQVGDLARIQEEHRLVQQFVNSLLTVSHFITI